MGFGAVKPYTAALVGLGNIAWRFNSDAPLAAGALTHAKAYQLCPEIDRLCGFSPERKDREDFVGHYGLLAYSDFNQMLDNEKPDIVSICSPVECHYQQVVTCVERTVPMVWLEKPIARNIQEVDQLLEIIEHGNTKVLVNYQRRFMGVYQELRNMFRLNDFGKCLKIHLNYSKGLEQNGSHILDILFYVLGDNCQWSLEWVASDVENNNPSFVLKMQEGLEVIVVGADVPYHCIDIAVIFEQGRASILHGGMTFKIEKRAEHEFFPGFFRLKESEILPGGSDMLDAMSKALNELIDSHKRGEEPVSSVRTAKQSMRVIHEVRKWQMSAR